MYKKMFLKDSDSASESWTMGKAGRDMRYKICDSESVRLWGNMLSRSDWGRVRDNWVKTGRMDVVGSKKLELKVAMASRRREEIEGAERCNPPAVASSNLCLGWSKVRSHEK